MNRLFRQVDNAPLILFRIFLGLLLACETFGAILTGWVKENLINPEFTFSHIGMDWLQPLPGYGMYYYFAAMGILGLLIMIGYRYRLSMGLFTILWAGAYFMQKTSYNNHYYLLILVGLIMTALPAHKYASVDVKRNPSLRRLTMPAWCSWVMIVQISIVYFYASLAKFYPDWLDGSVTHDLLARSFSPSLREYATHPWFYYFIAYAGIGFDLLVVPLLLYRKTRTIALIASLIFHIFNSITLQIGIFPFFALSFVVFFYPPETIRKLFFPNKPTARADFLPQSEGKKLLKYVFLPYLIIQTLLPLRHYFIKGDVLWTEEGHRLSWRMMLRSRGGNTDFRIVEKKTGEKLFYDFNRKLGHKQIANMNTKPDMIWQMAQRIKSEFAKEGKDVAVYTRSMVYVNRGPRRLLIDPNVDLASAEWDYFFHCDWIFLYDDNGNIVR